MTIKAIALDQKFIYPMIYEDSLKIDEALLIEECKKQKRQAQAVLYEKYYAKLVGVSQRYMSDLSSAQDVTQDCFIKIFKAIKKFRGDSAIYSWMSRIVVHESIRRLKKSKILTFDSIPEAWVETEEIQEHEVDSLQVDVLFQLIMELPVGYRSVLSMYSIEGFSHKEIAKELGISESSSRSQLARARSLLRKKLKNIKHGKNS